MTRAGEPVSSPFGLTDGLYRPGAWRRQSPGARTPVAAGVPLPFRSFSPPERPVPPWAFEEQKIGEAGLLAFLPKIVFRMVARYQAGPLPLP